MIEFEPLRKEHLSLVREWLARPHIRPWWRDSIDESIKAGSTYVRDVEEEGRPHRLMRLDHGYAQ